MIRPFIALVALSFAGVSNAASTEDSFTDEMLARLQSTMPGKTLHKSDEPLVITSPETEESDEAFYNLHRIYLYCQNAPAEDCETQKQDYVTKLAKPLPKASKEALRIIVRDEDYVDYLRNAIAADSRTEYRQIGDGLYALIALDSPAAISVPDTETLKEMGLTQEEAWSLATEQTKAILPRISLDALKNRQPLAFENFEYLPAMLADTDWWASVVPQLSPDLFVTAVSDQFVFIAFMPDGPDMDNFKQTVQDDCRTQARCITPFVYRFRNGGWAVAD